MTEAIPVVEPVPPSGVRYYAVVDAFDESVPLWMIASVNGPKAGVFDNWRQYRFDNLHKRWVEDSSMVSFFIGGMDGLRARSLTDEQAGTILNPWGGKLGDFPAEKDDDQK
jgi:hypothetical protein